MPKVPEKGNSVQEIGTRQDLTHGEKPRFTWIVSHISTSESVTWYAWTARRSDQSITKRNQPWIFTGKTDQFSSVQSLSRVWLFATPWIAACQASLCITNSRSSLRLMSIKSVMPSSHLILCRPLLLLPSIPPSIRVFSNESTLRFRWPKYWTFSFSIFLPKNTQGWSPSEWTGWISLQTKGLSRVFFNTTVQKHQFFCAQLSL